MDDKNNCHVLKTDIVDDKIRMEIRIDDLIFLFESSEQNEMLDDRGFFPRASIKLDKKIDFAKYFIDSMYDEYNQETGMPYYGIVFEAIFDKLAEDYVDFLNYSDDEDEN